MSESQEIKSLGAHATGEQLDIRGNPVKIELGPERIAGSTTNR